jgi:hypothetical protein
MSAMKMFDFGSGGGLPGLTVPDKKTYIEYKNNNCSIPNDTEKIKLYIKDVENRLIEYSKNKVLT